MLVEERAQERFGALAFVDAHGHFVEAKGLLTVLNSVADDAQIALTVGFGKRLNSERLSHLVREVGARSVETDEVEEVFRSDDRRPGGVLQPHSCGARIGRVVDRDDPALLVERVDVPEGVAVMPTEEPPFVGGFDQADGGEVFGGRVATELQVCLYRLHCPELAGV